MDKQDLKKMSITELEKELREKRQAARDLRFKISLSEHSQVRDLRKLKREIARIITMLKEKTASAAKLKNSSPSSAIETAQN